MYLSQYLPLSLVCELLPQSFFMLQTTFQKLIFYAFHRSWPPGLIAILIIFFTIWFACQIGKHGWEWKGAHHGASLRGFPQTSNLLQFTKQICATPYFLFRHRPNQTCMKLQLWIRYVFFVHQVQDYVIDCSRNLDMQPPLYNVHPEIPEFLGHACVILLVTVTMQYACGWPSVILAFSNYD